MLRLKSACPASQWESDASFRVLAGIAATVVVAMAAELAMRARRAADQVSWPGIS